ncbi:MAG: hypothetical protein ABWY05_05005 [Noviherbaspirillum sp.]
MQLARLSRLTLLYHGPQAWTDAAGRERAAAIAAAAAGGGEVVVVFDAGSDMPVPDLLAEIEAAVLKAAPDAPLAPPMAGPVEALAFWQEALGLRFMLIFHRFDIALARPDPEFDQALLRLVRDPLNASLLLLMDEVAAPLLQRLRDELPDLGEAYLRMPEPLATEEAPPPPSTLLEPLQELASLEPLQPLESPEPLHFQQPLAPLQPLDPLELLQPLEPLEPLPPLQTPAVADDAVTQTMDGPQAQQRRSRGFSDLLEQASTSYDEADTVTGELPLESAAGAHAPADGKLEPWLAPAPLPAIEPPPVGPYRERLPLQAPAWMHKRLGRRRRASLAMAAATARSSTIIFITLLVLALLCWQVPLAPP